MDVDPTRHADADPMETVPGDSFEGTVSADVAQAIELERGETVGRHLVLRRLGEGAMGVVYAAHDPELDRQLALKLLRGRGDVAGSERLLREARAMARLSHPNVVTVHDVGRHGDAVYVAMEFVDGPTLRAWLDEAERPLRDVVDVFQQAARGLMAAHEAGVVHRDFKPDNVMLDHRGRVRVMDFGLAADVAMATVDAHQTSPATSSRSLGKIDLTLTGAVMGTPAYMAPEQHLGQRATARTDQFAWALALYEALNGQRPFAGDTLAVLAFNVVQGKVRDAWSAAVPAWLRQVIMRSLAVEPDARYDSFAPILDELTRDRRSARRTRTTAAAGVIGIGLAAWGGAMLSAAEEPPAPCTGATDAIAEVWAADTAERVRAKFLESTRPFAASSADVVVRSMDEWSEAWAADHTRVCEATHVQHGQSAAALDHRMGCLDDVRREADALVGLFEEADDALIERSVVAVGALRGSGRCTHARPGDTDAPPSGSADSVSTVRDQLARSRARRHAGHYEAALEQSRAAHAGATAIGWTPLLAETGMELGRSLGFRAEFEAAEEQLTAAFHEAVAAGLDHMPVAAATELVYVIGTGRGRGDDALAWSRHAESTMRRTGDSEMRPVLLKKRADVHAAAARIDDALADLEMARSLVEADEADTLSFDIANSIGNTLAAAGRFDEARASYERAREIAVQIWGEEHPNQAMAVFNLGTIDQHSGDIDGAHEKYSDARDRFARAMGEFHPRVGDACLNIGNLAQRRKDLPAARAEYERALAIYDKSLDPNHPRTADLLSAMSNLEADEGDVARAVELGDRALAIYVAAHGHDHPDVGLARFNRGWMLLDNDDLEGARLQFEHALRIFEASTPEGHPYRGFAHGGLGDLAMTEQRPADAIAHYRAALIGEGLPLEERATVEFSLARALVDSGGDAEEAVGFARTARDRYDGELHREARAEIDAWLAAR